MSEKFYHEITDKQWEIISPHLPKPKSTGRLNLNNVSFSTQFFGYCKVTQNGDIFRKNMEIEIVSQVMGKVGSILKRLTNIDRFEVLFDRNELNVL